MPRMIWRLRGASIRHAVAGLIALSAAAAGVAPAEAAAFLPQSGAPGVDGCASRPASAAPSPGADLGTLGSGGLQQSRLARLRAAQEGIAPAGFASAIAIKGSSNRAAGIGPQRCAARLVAISGKVETMLTPSIMMRVLPSGMPSVFGSTAIPIGRTPLDGRWRKVRGSSLAVGAGPWSALLHEASGKPRLEAFDMANRWVNSRLTFTADAKDNWAGARQTLLSRRGDCEDYAIAKLALLRSLGVREEDLYLVVVRDMAVRDDHMLLVVREGGRLYALDSRSDGLLDATRAQDYRPIMTFSGEKAWVHGYSAAGDMAGLTAR